MTPLLQVEHLTIYVKHHNKTIPVVKDISFYIHQGECLGIVGESGCGKSLTAQTIACLNLFPYEGKIILAGRSLQTLNEKEKRLVRAKDIGMIFQNPQASLNPTMIVGEQIREVSSRLTKNEVINLMHQVGLSNPERCYRSYAHELSGGMCQRIMIALAVIRQPKLIIADEPTTALDVGIQVQILELLKSIQKNTQTSSLLITHDFDVVARVCDRVMVMYAGEIVEEGLVEQILHQPKHPYTKALLASRPQLGKGKTFVLESISGSPPTIENLAPGCSFQPRCNQAKSICLLHKPLLQNQEKGLVACWNLNQDNHV